MIRTLSFLVLIGLLTIVYSCSENSEKKNNREWDAQFLPLVARSYLEEDKLTDAEEAYTELVKLFPDDASNYAHLALVYLKLNKFKEARKQIKKALRLDPDNPDIHMIYAKYYLLTDDLKSAVEELETILKQDPDHTPAIYNLSEIYARQTGPESQLLREKYLLEALEKAPGNIVPRLDLIVLFQEKNDLENVTVHLEELPKIFAEFPKESNDSYRSAIDAIHAGNWTTAKRAIVQLQNFLKVTGQYQSDLVALNGPETSLSGLSIVTLSDFSKTFAEPGETTLDRIRFIDMTEQVNINAPESFGNTTIREKSSSSHFTLGDYNHDGFVDIYLNNYSSVDHSSTSRLLKNKLGTKFEDEAEVQGIQSSGREISSLFSDVNNDGHLDLYVVCEGPNLLFKQDSKGHFINVAVSAGVNDPDIGHAPVFLDADQDGDLDLLLTGPGKNRLYRNNGDGTFSQKAEEMGLGISDCSGAGFADCDQDGDLEILLTKSSAAPLLLSNIRHGRFEDLSGPAGLSQASAAKVVRVVDANNDGYTDLFLLGASGQSSALWTNNGDGTFTKTPSPWLASISQMTPRDAAFFDFDNDGFMDLAITGKPQTEKDKGLILLHNEGGGIFTDVTTLLPSSIQSGYHIETADFDKDGDLDLFVNDQDGKVHLLQNEGGNLNHYLDIQLVGLRNGNGKNNHFGIGAKVEVRAGDLYQMQVVTQPMIHFGLGTHLKADVMRVTWPNGVAQDKFFPGSDELLLELQNLKGSCAFLYTWDGRQYTFSKDMMWRSALGMPLGIMGSNTAWAPADASQEYLKIPGEAMVRQGDQYRIQITEELWETAYFDQLFMVAVDHPADEEVFVDEAFTLPPYTDQYTLHAVKKRFYPMAVTDQLGTDLLEKVLKKDDDYIANFSNDKYQGITEMHELIITPGRDLPSGNILLYLNGWIFPSDASINVALGQSNKLAVLAPELQVINPQGKWETVIPGIGFPMGKDKTMIVDLSGKFLSADRRVRIRTNMEIYWDEIFFAPKSTLKQQTATHMDPIAADLHFRGFSKPFRKGGRHGPHWFDYSTVTTDQKWRDLTGYYTRFGEVSPLLKKADDQLVIMNSGDEMTVAFDATLLPVLPAGWKRDFLIYSNGWIKDGDLNTAHGNTVEPLPFQAMNRYPYGSEQAFPSDPVHQEYRQRYNTRKVDTRGFRHALKQVQ